jgi:hypothetical protein
MISKMTDEDMLDFLMTSEFENDISPDEFRYLLNKWKYFYRVIHGRLERTRQDLSFEVDSLKGQIVGMQESIVSAQMDVAKKEDEIHSLKNRKLTFKERWTGKIITKEDEDK